MFEKNKDFGVALQPVVMALTLNRQKQRERIIIGPEWEVQMYMEGKMVKTKLLVMERPLGQLIFDWSGESAKDWNEAVIYELKSALQNPFQRRKRERKAFDFLAQKVVSDNVVSIFWAKNCRNVYKYCKKKIPFKQSADLFESRMMTLTIYLNVNELTQTLLDTIKDQLSACVGKEFTQSLRLFKQYCSVANKRLVICIDGLNKKTIWRNLRMKCWSCLDLLTVAIL